MEICTVGGFEEVGKNMTAVKVGEDVFLIDCGFFLPGVIELQEESKIGYTRKGLRRVGGIPDDRVLDRLGWTKKVKAIFISHAHLDHVAGLPFLIDRYPNARIYATPFTMRVLDSLISDSGISFRNPKIVVQSNSIHTIPNASSDVKVEFVHTTHSTIDCTFVVLHTPEGSLFYALDYKFDDTPTFGPPPNYSKLKELGRKGIKMAIINTLYASKEEPNGSETDADRMLKETFEASNNKNSAFFVTTFSSHIERLNNIVKHAMKTNREIIFLGRSLEKYVSCAIAVGKCPFRNKIKMVKYRRQINSVLKKVDSNRGKYLVVCTGHQGEKNSILDRIAKGETPFKFRENDNLIFSSSVIPVEVNIKSREILDSKLEKIGVKLHKNIHVHGHGSKGSKEKLIKLIKPEIIIPSHGTREQEKGLVCVAKEMGYTDKNVFLSRNGNVVKI